MPFSDKNNSTDPSNSITASEEEELLKSFGAIEETQETATHGGKKTTLPPVRRSKLATSASVDKREAQKKLAPREEMINTAKELLKRAGTSVEELAKGSNQVQKGFNLQKKVAEKKKPTEKTEREAKSNEKKSKQATPQTTSDSFAESDIFDEIETDEIKVSADEESTSTESRKRRERTIYKKGFFYYMGIASCVGVFLGIAFLTHKFINNLLTAPIPTVDEVAVISAEEANKAEAVKTLIPILEDDATVADARKAAEDYFTSSSKRFAYSYVATNTNVSSAFNKYWEAEKDYTPELLTFYEGFTLPDNSQWISFKYGIDASRKQVIMTKQPGENFKIDWQALSEIETISLKDLNNEVNTNPHAIRAWLTENAEHPVKFPETFWESFILHDAKGETINCYLAKNTTTLKKLKDNLLKNYKSHPTGGDKGLYVKMLVHKPEIGVDYLEVLDVTATSWNEEVESLRDSLRPTN